MNLEDIVELEAKCLKDNRPMMVRVPVTFSDEKLTLILALCQTLRCGFVLQLR